MKKTYIVNLTHKKEIYNLYDNADEDKQIVIVADNIIAVDNVIEFTLNGTTVGFFRKEDIHSFYEYEEFKPVALDGLLDEFILSWRGIISLGADSIKKIYQKGLGTDSQYIVNCLLTDICEETKHQYDKYNGNLICSQCFKQYQKIDDYKENSLVYYGCPDCKQTNRFYTNVQKTICLLDNQSHLGHYLKDDILYVNWLVTNKDFDFNSVLVLNATDYDIEKFVINMSDKGLDTKKIQLTANCVLSDNSRKILARYFLV